MNGHESPSPPAGQVSPDANPPRVGAFPSRKGVGGTFSHRPFCRCHPCTARRRDAEAVVGAAGVGGSALETSTVYLPKLVDTKKRRRNASRSLRDRCAEYLHYTFTYPNMSRVEIAEKMGIGRSRLYDILREGQAMGLLTFEDPIDRIDYELIPKVVDNLNHFLDIKDKAVTIETAKGTLFRAYQESKGVTDGNQTVLALKIETAPGADVKVVTGHIVGTPKGLPRGASDPIGESHEA